MHRLWLSERSGSERERARQQYRSCIIMYINVATIPSIIKAKIMAASTLNGLKETERVGQ